WRTRNERVLSLLQSPMRIRIHSILSSADYEVEPKIEGRNFLRPSVEFGETNSLFNLYGLTDPAAARSINWEARSFTQAKLPAAISFKLMI
ncbi:MAG: hypothetical protein K0Q59_259, partial [Paenibacillus sp.]|nr:hypothetical protein [Paenibacillus sp.]